MMRVRSIIFDLDDTLYLERDYVLSGIAAVGAWLRLQHGVTGFAELALDLRRNGQRGLLFDAALTRLGIAPTPEMVASLVRIYHNHGPEIALCGDAEAFLAHPGGRRLALITDGVALAQRRKIAALRLDRFGFDPLIVTAEMGDGLGKPHSRAFEVVAERHRCPPGEMVYVADNPAKDFVAPRALGWRTIQIDRAGAVHPRDAPAPSHAAELRITSLAALDAALERLADTPL